MDSKNYFDEVAGQWDGMRKGFFSDALREKAFLTAGARSGQTAADIGAGTGFITEGLVKRGLHVTAVDQSPAMLDEMKKKLEGIDTVEYRVGEAGHLPIDDASVDLVFANMYLHHVESPSAAIAEMARITKPGGKVVITDLDAHEFTFLSAEQHDRWPGFSREDVRNWFLGAGLKNPQIECAGENCCASSECGCDSASISIFVASGEK